MKKSERTKIVDRIHARATALKDDALALKKDFSFKGLFALVQSIAETVEQEYQGAQGLFKKEVVIETTLDLYDRNKWDFTPGVPSFIEKKLLKFVLNRGIDYIVDVLNKYVWKKED